MPRDHYSYTAYADRGAAESFDDRRFGGPIGELVASEQALVLESFIGEIRNHSVLDVGTGTGRAAILMARGGAQVTAVDASDEMLSIARRRAVKEQVSVQFLSGDAHQLEFSDRAFDVVTSLRVLMHAADWRRSVTELCRVADRLVIVDYPSVTSFAALQALARRLTYALGAHTEPYRVLGDRAVARAFDASGFRVRSVHRQFALPIALHKAIGSRRFTSRSESLLKRLGLVGLIGTPVTLVAERCKS